jgi:CxxC motif-containing protein (DUF1111 family)
MEDSMMKFRSRAWFDVMLCGSLITGCASGADQDDIALEDTVSSAITAVGDALPGTDAAGFAEAKAAFEVVDTIDDGVGPIFNERGCAVCHFQGAIGGAGTQIERRFGTFVNGRFEPLANDGLGPFPARGGSLRQLMTLGDFTGLNGQRCHVPLEREPPEATVHNVGRQTTPLFGLGLVDAMPDSFFDGIAASQPTAIRGIANRVSILLPNLDDSGQRIGGTRVGRFGWKSGIATLSQFAADAYVNEIGITTQHCVAGRSITTFSTEQQPNGIAQPAGCDDRAPPVPADVRGVPASTDEFVGTCANGQSELQEDVAEFTEFMTLLAPAPRAIVDQAATTRGQALFSQVGCNGCHLATAFRTPASPANGVPGNFSFSPFSDFLVHDMGDGGDFIGNFNDTVAVTRRMRTAPLWGIRFRTQLMHDGTAGDIPTAIGKHQGQGSTAAGNFSRLSAAQKNDLVTFVRSL